MKKRNEKGFLLVEAIVVGVFVLSLFTFLFVNIIPLVGKYETEAQYDTITGIYNANLIRSMIMGDANSNDVLKLKIGSTDYKYQDYDVDTLCSKLEKENYCKKLLGKTYLNVNKVYITWYRSASIKGEVERVPESFPRAVREYIENMDNYTQPTGNTYDSYKRIIVYYNDGTLANLEVKVKEA